MNYKSIFQVLIMTPMLLACVPQSIYYKEGASYPDIDRASTDCQVKAAQSVPVNTQIGTTSTYTTPVQTSCYAGYGGYVSCNSSGGQTYGGDVYSYDANSNLRNRVANQCMQQKGFRLIELPTCTAAKAQAGVSQKLPQLNANSCVTKSTNGGLIVISP